MSGQAAPISPERFAAALRDLPLSSLHAKAAEIRNSMAHLRESNEQLQPLAADGDKDCAEAFWENLQVIKSMDDRLQLVKAEVEGRGYLWDVSETRELQPGQVSPPGDDTAATGSAIQDQVSQTSSTSVPSAPDRTTGGTLDDAELARRLAEQMDEDAGGVHL